MKRAALLVSLLLLFVLSGIPAFADRNGANVTVNYLYPEINDIYEVLGTGVVTPGGFNVNWFGQHDFTVFPGDLTLTNVAGEDINFTSADFNGYGLVVNSGGTAIIGVTIGFNDISRFDLNRDALPGHRGGVSVTGVELSRATPRSTRWSFLLLPRASGRTSSACSATHRG